MHRTLSLIASVPAVAVLILGFLSQTAAAFSVDVSGPVESQPDRLVILEAQGDGPTAFKWIAKVDKLAYLEFEGRRRIAFVPARPGEYQFMLVAAGVDENGKVAIATDSHTVTVSGDAPDPEPDPDPDPTPFGLTKFAREKLSLIPPDARRKAPAIAGVFLSSCGKAVGTDSTVAKLNAEIASGNVKALGADREKWEPWLKALQLELARLARSGRLITLTQHVAAYREVAAGLK